MSQPTKADIQKNSLLDFSLRKFLKRNGFSYLMLMPAFIIVALVIIYPFLYNFNLAFTNLSRSTLIDFLREGKLHYIGLNNFVEVLTQSTFWTVLLRTLIWTIVNVFCHVTFGIFFAILLDRDMIFKGIYRALLILPWAIPQYISVLVWKGMFNYNYGAVNILLERLSQIFDFTYEPIAWLSNPTTGFMAAIIVNVWVGIPFMMMIALGGLQSIDPNYYEAAEIDGASGFQQVKHITLPLLKPVMMPAVILGVIMTFNNLNVIYLLSFKKLTEKIDILVTYVYKAAFGYFRLGYAAAFSVIIFLILLGFSTVFIKQNESH
ncbi:carbohydrate ABC transporter permease [Halanaerobacter jeridensis]|uniref:Arabinogalactan oligomer/maltooligosaccharide transport system permease protein n=1 Tax=Halanaerobacter jeridensis TaxID=706427 RepID=A0A939BSK0_9FIRM|nr:sugar ABC transporter permease [Halanaerobacter jeridensis]MBM7557226.1 arabinogalactan oligomer/maltooligosaccharide transport system permease protein [Halanaerobacter jeridensis]